MTHKAQNALTVAITDRSKTEYKYKNTNKKNKKLYNWSNSSRMKHNATIIYTIHYGN